MSLTKERLGRTSPKVALQRLRRRLPRPPVGGGRQWLTELRAMLVRNKPAIRRLLLNWGVLIVAVTTVLVVRYRSEAHVRARLPPPTVHLSASDVRQWLYGSR